MFELYPHQQDTINQTREALRSHNSVLIQAPTGSGKTVLSADMLGRASHKNKRSFFICHRAELIDQTSKTFDDVGIPHGFIASGLKPDPWQPVQICSIDTLKNRLDSVVPPDFCVWDEAHHVAANGWAKVHEKYSHAKHVGLTATPQRLDGKGLGDWFSHMVKGPSVSWLIDNGYLSQYKVFAPSMPDLTGIHKRMGDYVNSELTELMDNNVITGNAISHYKRLANGKRAIAFCVSIKHSLHVTEQFVQSGIKAVHIDGTTAKAERKEYFRLFRAGQIDIICNVDIAGEGVDVPAIEAAILLRPTQSLALYLQQVGRSLRVIKGKDHAIILDHAGNTMRHGLLDEDRDWTLEDRDRKGKGKNEGQEINARQCPECFCVHEPSPLCPECGYKYTFKEKMPEEKEGELEEIDKERLKQQRRREMGAARTLEDLQALGKARGYKPGWAKHIWNARQARR